MTKNSSLQTLAMGITSRGAGRLLPVPTRAKATFRRGARRVGRGRPVRHLAHGGRRRTGLLAST